MLRLFLVFALLFGLGDVAMGQQSHSSSANRDSPKVFGDVRWYTPGAHGDIDLYIAAKGRLGVNLVYDNQHQDMLVGGGPSWMFRDSEKHRIVGTFCLLTDRGRQSHYYTDVFGALKLHADGTVKKFGYVIKASVIGDFSDKELSRWGFDELELSRDIARWKKLRVGVFGLARAQFRGEYEHAAFVDVGGGISAGIGSTRVHVGYYAPVNQPHTYLDHHHGEKRKGVVIASISLWLKEDTAHH